MTDKKSQTKFFSNSRKGKRVSVDEDPNSNGEYIRADRDENLEPKNADNRNLKEDIN
jgi:hypothetical protein